jgi:hypothetical protein
MAIYFGVKMVKRLPMVSALQIHAMVSKQVVNVPPHYVKIVRTPWSALYIKEGVILVGFASASQVIQGMPANKSMYVQESQTGYIVWDCIRATRVKTNTLLPEVQQTALLPAETDMVVRVPTIALSLRMDNANPPPQQGSAIAIPVISTMIAV